MSPLQPASLGNAVWVRDGRIHAIGQKDHFRSQRFSEVLHFDGSHLLPGFVESHAHLWWMGQLASQIDCGPPHNQCVADILEKIRQAAHTQPRGTWILGHHWDDTVLHEERPPTKSELDRVAPHHPVYLLHNSGHLAVANQRAFELAGINSQTTIEGIVHGEDRQLTGLLLESQALESITRHIPLPTINEMVADIGRAVELCHRAGVTSSADAAMGLGNPESVQRVWEAYQLAEARQVLRTRTTCYVRAHGTKDEIPSDPSTPFLSVPGIKLFSDGSIQGHTAKLIAPYFDRADEHGILVLSHYDLVKRIQSYHEQGVQIAIHANGDAAIETVISAYKEALGERGAPERRHRIEHAQMAHFGQLQAMEHLGVLPNFFIGHVFHWGDRHRDRFIGPERAENLDPLAWADSLGIQFALHSDSPVTPINPLASILTATTRKTSSGKLLGSSQRISIARAWRAYTTDAAYLGFRESEVGDIRVGQWADFVALSQNPLLNGPEAFDDIEIEATLVGGEVVYRK